MTPIRFILVNVLCAIEKKMYILLLLDGVFYWSYWLIVLFKYSISLPNLCLEILSLTNRRYWTIFPVKTNKQTNKTYMNMHTIICTQFQGFSKFFYCSCRDDSLYLKSLVLIEIFTLFHTVSNRDYLIKSWSRAITMKGRGLHHRWDDVVNLHTSQFCPGLGMAALI